MRLTKYGIWTSANSLGEANLGAAAKLAEQLGFGAIWLGGSPRLTVTRELLAATEQLTVATGIVNVWQYDGAALAAEFQALDAEFPGRLLLGIGIGHPEATSEYQKPLTKMRTFLDEIAATADPVPQGRMVMAALGPKMLELSFDRTLGTHPYFTPVEHTRFAREHLGAAALVAPEVAVVMDSDRAKARQTAGVYASRYLRLSNYTSNLRRFGFDDADLAGNGSGRLLDAIVPQGNVADVARVVRAHIDAGADHVCVQTLGVTGVPEREWSALAQTLLGDPD